MDLLASLGLDGALPEQSTRLSSHPGVARALEGGGDVRLGFTDCLRCGAKLMGDGDNVGGGEETTRAPVACKGCRRVNYCSSDCRKADAEAIAPSSKEDEDAAAGHSPVICSLLNLCEDDETAEADLRDELNGKQSNKKRKRRDEASDRKAEAARYRVRTELESYPATLFNVPSEGPDWFVEALTRRLRSGEDVLSPEPKRRRRGKRERSSLSPTKEGPEYYDEEGGGSGRKWVLVMHVIGASADAELWGWDGKATHGSDGGEAPVLEAYAEASGNLHSYLKNLLESSAISIRCIFVGPDCPAASPCRVAVPIPDARLATLSIETHRCSYADDEGPRLPSPDIVVYFNPGLSCPDYDWSKALLAAAAYSSTGPVPFLVTTNTEMEALADTKCLLESGCVDPKDLPEDVLEAVDWKVDAVASTADEDGEAFFLGENPYAGLRVRQSGTMGNDLYVKSRWIFGGLLKSAGTKRKSGKKSLTGKSSGEKRARKRRRSEERGNSGGDRNAKRRNPALI